MSKKQLDFSMVIASAVHDMKNSLGMMLHSLEELQEEWPGASESRRFSTLQYEAQRVHGDLVQLLGLYRLGNETLSVHTEEHFVPDFLDEQLAQHRALLEGRGIQADFQAEEVEGYFDHDLIAGVLTNTINNAIRYTHQRIRLSGREEDGFLVLSVEDDGQGYPPHMMEAPQGPPEGIDFQSGSTHLGLYFAREVARLHQEAGRTGSIRMRNGGELGGGIFELWLP